MIYVILEDGHEQKIISNQCMYINNKDFHRVINKVMFFVCFSYMLLKTDYFKIKCVKWIF